MTDPTLQLNPQGEVVQMDNEGSDPEIDQVKEAKDSRGNPVQESDPDFDYYANITDEELAQELAKLSPADKIQYN